MAIKEANILERCSLKNLKNEKLHKLKAIKFTLWFWNSVLCYLGDHLLFRERATKKLETTFNQKMAELDFALKHETEGELTKPEVEVGIP